MLLCLSDQQPDSSMTSGATTGKKDRPLEEGVGVFRMIFALVNTADNYSFSGFSLHKWVPFLGKCI